jgi:GT2 family glycosyltransferase
MPAISVIVIARNEGAELRHTVSNLIDTLPPDAEILVLDDGSHDGAAAGLPRRVRVKCTGGIGVARARNYGARQARGDVFIFADAHIRVPPDWWRPLLRLLRNPRVGAAAPGIQGMAPGQGTGFGLTFLGPDLGVGWLNRPQRSPSPALILPGCCLAIRRDTFESVGGWDSGLYGIGGNDNEFCLRLWLHGYRLLVAPDVVVLHRFRKRSRVPLDPAHFLHNRLRLALVHLKPERAARVFAAHHDDPALRKALALLLAGDALERRRTLAQTRNKNDDWCFKQFGLIW